jgi:hypothetical protein
MTMTEEQAKTKWCPYARTLAYDTFKNPATNEWEPATASINREAGHYDKRGMETVQVSGRHRCIASECMAWRAVDKTAEWDVESGSPGPGWVKVGEPKPHPMPLEPGEMGQEWRLVGGYCGLAGSPQ